MSEDVRSAGRERNRLTISHAALAVFLAAPLTAAGSERSSATPPWRDGTAWKYRWIVDGHDRGQSDLRFRKVEGAPVAAEAAWRLLYRRELDTGGRKTRVRGELRLRGDGRPLQCEEHVRLGLGLGVAGEQVLRVKFLGRRAVSEYVHNGRSESAVRREVEIPEECFLFASASLEQWCLFTPRLCGRQKLSVRVYYPQFARVLPIEFRRLGEGAEKREIAGKTLTVTSYRFEMTGMKFTGEILIDSLGRLIEYSSGPLRLRFQPE